MANTIAELQLMAKTDIDHTALQLTPADDGLRANELEFIKNNLTILMAIFIVF